ncbi:hypothetical protein ABMY26_07930 [Azospirillum sp. HJ39]|uniref:hypothetical protein n=1 Tax=Azospirillum sp. HJ39 TaxID=3159496 RepID=UPI0035566018
MKYNCAMPGCRWRQSPGLLVVPFDHPQENPARAAIAMEMRIEPVDYRNEFSSPDMMAKKLALNRHNHVVALQLASAPPTSFGRLTRPSATIRPPPSTSAPPLGSSPSASTPWSNGHRLPATKTNLNTGAGKLGAVHRTNFPADEAGADIGHGKLHWTIPASYDLRLWAILARC